MIRGPNVGWLCTTYILEIRKVTLCQGCVAKSDWIYFFSSLLLTFELYACIFLTMTMI